MPHGCMVGGFKVSILLSAIAVLMVAKSCKRQQSGAFYNLLLLGCFLYFFVVVLDAKGWINNYINNVDTHKTHGHGLVVVVCKTRHRI